MNKKTGEPNRAAELRQRAEELAHRETLPRDESRGTERELDELRVYQIELEMQNEELTRAHTELDAERARYFDLYDLAPVGYMTVSELGVILEANLTAATLLGLERGSLLRQPLSRFIQKEDAGISFQQRQKAIETGTTQVCDLRMLKNADVQFWACLETTAAQGSDGKPVCLVALSDITARKRAEEALRESEEKHRLIVENTSDGIIIFGADNHIQYVSPAYLKQLGYSEIDELSRTPEIIHSIIHPDERETVFSEIFKAIRCTKSELTYTYRVKHLAGHYIWREDNAKFIYDSSGNYGGSYVICRDVTARKQAEEHLRSSEERFRSLASSFNDIIYSLDTQQRHSGIYENWVENIGLTPEFFLGKTSREIFGAEAALVHEEANQHALAGEPVTYEWSAPAASGVSYYQTAVSPLRNSQGEIVGIVGVGRDITERRAAEENIRLLNIELEKLALTDYLTNLSNRRYFMQRGAEEFKRAQRNNQPLALLMVDIDEFKKVNDSYGHETGDLALQQVAAMMKSSLREIDLLGRLGGEEFAVLLPDTSKEEAVVLAERVRQSIANMSFETPGQVLSNPITISVGVAVISDEMSSIDDLLRIADAAMYRAKQSGRNRVVVDQGNPDLSPRRE